MTVAIIIVAALLAALLTWLTIEYSLFIPPKKGLPVLMYHKVSQDKKDRLTVTANDLELHFAWMKERGYHSLSFRELKQLIKEGEPLPRKSVILTFDDGYRDFRTIVLPLLKKFDLKATVFVPLAYIGKTNSWDNANDPLMSADDLRAVAGDPHVEAGIHSFLHKSYADMAIEDMDEDLKNCFSTISYYNLPFVRALAYPFGGYPKNDPVLKEQMFTLFKEREIDFALRIGNQVNKYPLKQPYELKRIDVRGTDSFFVFRTKLRKGRAKLFS